MRPIVNYFQESIQELSKINWPTRQQAIRLTLAVGVFSLVLALFMGLIDVLFNTLVKRFIIKG